MACQHSYGTSKAIHEAERLLPEIEATATPNTASLRRLRQAASKRLRNAASSSVLAVAKTLIDNKRRWLGSNLSTITQPHPATHVWRLP